MFYISALIDDRKYQVLTLFPGHVGSKENDHTPTFILERNHGEDRMLFSLDEQAKLIFKGGFKHDAEIDFENIQTTLEGSDFTVVLTSVGEGPKNVRPQSQQEYVRTKKSDHKYHFGIANGVTEKQITVTIRYETGGPSFSGSFIVNLVPENTVFDVVMDFGSEATQIVVHRRGKDITKLERTAIVQKLIDFYYPDLQTEALHQRNADKDLYNSQFFARKSESVFQPADPAGTHRNEELLNLLTKRNDIYELAKNHMFVSNLKLAHLGAYQQEIRFKSRESNIYGAEHKRFSEIVLDLQQTVINYFIQMVLKDLCARHKTEMELYISVRLLVPNVFDQYKVSQMVRNTYRSLAEICRKSSYPLAGWEVSTTSESDASFLGFKKEKEVESRRNNRPYWVTDRDYLIIDAGKGTIDFSILNWSKNNRLKSVFRSGFIGAGNVISYAFVDTIFIALFGKDTRVRKKAIYDICLAPHAEMVYKIEFTELIEQLKQHYEHARNAEYRPLAQIIPVHKMQDLRNEYNANPGAPTLLKQIIEMLRIVIETQRSIQDEFQLINDTVNLLVQKIEEEISYSAAYDSEKTEKIILTGRGFMFKRLQRAIQLKFNKTVDVASDLKKICLTGAFSSDRINFDSNLVGYPDTHRFVIKPDNQVELEVHKGENIPTKTIKVAEGIFAKTQSIASVASQSLEKLSKVFELSDTNTVGAAPVPMPAAEKPRKPEPDNDDPETIFLTGAFFPDFNPDTDIVAICGIDYKKHNIRGGRINVFYTGQEFIIRDADMYCDLNVSPDFFKETQWVFQTLYPFLEVSGADDVKLIKEFGESVQMDFS